MNLEDLRELMSSLEGCCLHEAQWHAEDVSEVLLFIWDGGWWHEDDYGWRAGYPKEYTDNQSLTVVKLKDGGYGLLEESEDYSGHGCQCDSFTARYPSLAELVSAQPEYQRKGLEKFLA